MSLAPEMGLGCSVGVWGWGWELSGTCTANWAWCLQHSSVARAFLRRPDALNWVLVKGFNFSYHNKETILFTFDSYYGNLN